MPALVPAIDRSIQVLYLVKNGEPRQSGVTDDVTSVLDEPWS